MSRYDDERIVALLHDAVPPVPDPFDRVAAIRHKAGRQRAALWTQTLGAMASVLLVIGLAAAVSNAGTTTGLVRPAGDPLAAFGEALAELTSVRFEVSMKPTEQIDTTGMEMSPGQADEMLTSSVTGALAENGDFEFTGDLSFLGVFGPSQTAQAPAVTFKFVGDAGYRTAFSYEKVPAGKTWIRTEGDKYDVPQLASQLRALQALAEDVHYVGGDTVRGEPVAEYELTVPAGVVPKPITVRFALDAANRLRRAAAVVSWRAMLNGDEQSEGAPADPLNVRIEAVFYGYGDDVRVTAPPRSEVTDETTVDVDMSGVLDDGIEIGGATEIPDEALQHCAEAAGTDSAKFHQCVTEFGFEGDGFVVLEKATMMPSPTP